MSFYRRGMEFHCSVKYMDTSCPWKIDMKPIFRITGIIKFLFFPIGLEGEYDLDLCCFSCDTVLNEPRREKTGLREFRPAPT